MKRKLALLIRSLRGLRQVVGIYIANLARALGLPAETTTFDSELVLPVLTEQVHRFYIILLPLFVAVSVSMNILCAPHRYFDSHPDTLLFLVGSHASRSFSSSSAIKVSLPAAVDLFA